MLRGQKVLLDSDLATRYGVETRVLVQAVKRNPDRFPEDFMFQLTTEEAASLRSQAVILKAGRGQHRKYLPYAFTEQGVAMLSSVLRSPRAIAVNVEIMRAFVRIRAVISANKEIARKMESHDHKPTSHDEAIAAVLSAIRELMAPPEPTKKRRIEFITDEE